MSLQNIFSKTSLFVTAFSSTITKNILSRGFRRWNDPKLPRFGYKYTNYYKGGLLPRTKEDCAELPMPMPLHAKKDAWKEKYAVFGQNDYIDILGNGNVHPVDLIQGPRWLIGFKGNELQRLVRQTKFEGRQMQARDPEKFAEVKRRIKYLNRRYNIKFGGKKK